MRRFLIVLLSSFSLLGLAACGDKTKPTGQGDANKPAAGSMGKMNDGMGTMKQ
jgi:hypothetical protein